MGFLSASGSFSVYFGLHDAVFPQVFSNNSQRPLQTSFIKAEIKLHSVELHLLIDIVALDFIYRHHSKRDLTQVGVFQRT